MRWAAAPVAGLAVALVACGGSTPPSYDRYGLVECLQQNGASIEESLIDTVFQRLSQYADSSFIARIQAQHIAFLFEADADEAQTAKRILEQAHDPFIMLDQRGNVIIAHDPHTTKGALRITDACMADATKT